MLDDLSSAGIAPAESAPLPDTSPAAEPAAPVREEAPESKGDDLDAELARVFRSANRERDPNGRFASREAAPAGKDIPPNPVGEKADQAPDTKPIEAPKAAPIDAPVSWSGDMKAKFATLPPDVQQYVAQRDRETHAEISKLGQAVRMIEPVGRLLQEHRDSFNARGVSYAQGLQQLLSAQRALDTDPASAIVHLANTYGVDLGQLTGSEGGSPQQGFLLEQIKTLTSELNALKGNIGNREAMEAQKREQELIERVSTFASKRPDFEELSADIYRQVEALKLGQPNLSMEELLEKAYEAARWANPKTRSKLIEEQTKEAEKKRMEAAQKQAEAARKAAGVNVKGRPGGNATDDLDSLLSATYRRLSAA